MKKISRHHDYSLELRKKERCFNETFFKAFFFAFLLHVAALIIFHIGPFKITNSRFLPPAVVEIESLERDQHVMTKIEGDSKLSRFPFAPKTSSLDLPGMPKLTMMRHMEHVEEMDFSDNPFLKVERDLQNETFFAVKETSNSKASIEIIFSGELANKKYEMSEDLLTSIPKNAFHAIYSVKVENKTGRIFFAETKSALLKEQYAPVIEKILKGIRFEKELFGFQSTGDIEIVLRGESF